MDWFTVDKKGLSQLLERRGKAFVLFELVQNAWDEKTTRVDIELARIPGTRYVSLVVRDDNPDGFADLSHAFTLFAQSAKKSDADKRGRFNLGEKLVLSMCEEASIASTRGTVVFDGDGRRTTRAKRAAGSQFTARLKMTDPELAQCNREIELLIPPEGIATIYNGRQLAASPPLATAEATLPTEVADGEGVLRRTRRKTQVRWFEPLEGHPAMLYEMGIPVVETDERWSVDIGQKVPLSFDRDNVPPAYLARVRALTLHVMARDMTTEDANATWARDALRAHGHELPADTIHRLVDLRFGDRRVAYDPSDPEANSRAVAAGYTVIHGGQMSRDEWSAVRRTGAIQPAGQVTPSPKPYSENGTPLRIVPQENYTPAIAAVVEYAKRIAPELIDGLGGLHVDIANEATWPFGGTYGPGRLVLNLGRLGHAWFEGPITPINDLLLHEFGHHYEADHLSGKYHEALTALGARMASLALDNPSLFVLDRPGADAVPSLPCPRRPTPTSKS